MAYANSENVGHAPSAKAETGGLINKVSHKGSKARRFEKKKGKKIYKIYVDIEKGVYIIVNRKRMKWQL
jgi:hypothetical protein